MRGAFHFLLLWATFYGRAEDLKSLENRIAESEAVFEHLKPGVDKKFRWLNSSDPVKTPYSIVYIHGFLSSRDEAEPLLSGWAKKLEANVFSTRLTGHGFESGEEMASATAEDWLKDADEAVTIGRQIGDKVIVVGKSTGGSVALLSVLKDQTNVEKLLLLSPNLGINHVMAPVFQFPGGLKFLKWYGGTHIEGRTYNEEIMRISTPKYPMDAVKTVSDVVVSLKKADWSSRLPPIMAIYHPEDTVVLAEKTEELIPKLNSPSVTLLPFNSTDGHILYDPTTAEGLENAASLAKLVEDFVVGPPKFDLPQCEDLF